MNLFENLISSELAAAIGETFMHSLWQITAVGVLLTLALLFIPKKSSNTRYRLGTAAMLLMFALPFITFFSVYQPGTAALASGSAPGGNGTLTTFALIPTGDLAGETILEQVQSFFNANGSFVMVLWLLGALFFSLRLVGSYLQVRNLRRRHTSAVPAELQATLDRLVKRMGIRRDVKVLQSSVISTPMVMGTLKPLVLVPVGLATGLSSEQVECLIAHELAHVRRMDYLVNVFQSIVEIVLFYHPVVWYTSKMVREERENCCDLAVIDVQENRITYARALLNLEAIRNSQPELAMASTGGKLFNRIQRITGQESVEKGSYSRGIFIGLFALLMVFTLSTTSSEPVKASTPYGDLLPPELQFDRDQQGNIIVLEDEENGGEEEVAIEEETEMDSDEPVVIAVESEARVFELKKIEKFAEKCKNEKIRLAFLGEGFAEMLNGFNYEFNPNHARFAHYNPMDQDSPITAIIIIEDGKEVRLKLDRQGNVVAGTKDGRTIPDDELSHYQDIVEESFGRHRGHHAPPMPPMPDMKNMPSAPDMGNIPPMPPMPPMPDMSDMPKPPAPPAPKRDNESDEAYERRMDKYEDKMEDYEDEMEDWGERLEARFEEGEWADYEKQMEEWGERFGEQFEKQFEGKDWEEYGRRWEEWGEEFAREFEGKDWKKFEKEMEKLGEQIEMEFDGEDWEKFGEEMAAWAEKFGAEIEIEMEELGRNIEKSLEHLNEMEFEYEYDHDNERFEEQVSSGMDRLRNALDNDGLVDSGDSFRLKINDEDLYINGDKQSRGTYMKYRDLIESMDIPVEDEEWVEINYKRGKSQIRN